jgi:hypothetical protein
MAKCWYLLPFRDLAIVRDEEELPECLLPDRHEGEHLVLTSYGYFAWEPQESFCEEDCKCDYIECYYHRSLSPKEAQAMMETRQEEVIKKENKEPDP